MKLIELRTRTEAAKSIADEFNRQWPVGTPVWLVQEHGQRLQTVTSSAAIVRSNDSYSSVDSHVLIHLKDVPGMPLLSNIVVINTTFVDPALTNTKTRQVIESWITENFTFVDDTAKERLIKALES